VQCGYVFSFKKNMFTNYKITEVSKYHVVKYSEMTQSETVQYEHEPAKATERLTCRFRHTRTFRLSRGKAGRQN
jgi:hypothetical protein